jgi:hypothetical protein
MDKIDSYIDNTLLPAIKAYIAEYIQQHYSVGELQHVAVRGILDKFWDGWIAEQHKGDMPITFEDMSQFKDILKAVIEPMLFVWRGEWSAAERYIVNDWVSLGGNTYICIAPADASSTPPSSDAERWALMAGNGAKGDKGDTGPQGVQGVKGDTGPQGVQGVKGTPGAQGVNSGDALEWYEPFVLKIPRKLTDTSLRLTGDGKLISI